MKIYDVTRPIFNEMVVFPGDPTVTHTWVSSTKTGGFVNMSKIDFGMHTGTHVDAPLHFLADGADLDQVDLAHFIGPARVVDIGREAKEITRADLEPFSPRPGERLLIKTDNSFRDPDAGFDRDYVPITKDACDYLAECGVYTVGVDFQTVGKGMEVAACHHALLGAGMCIIEGLRLADVPAGEYLLSALPLRIRGAEGCPVRAVLVSE